ncbi:hypothetical protein D9613_009936 [Agrocybe pediades]|uniref:Uncharacterized protein n=1 Tax=Agrocybe pediades TaxID=84607 RepID=A0A8H4QWW9_9AGAR|nr:hypothetical protein D9613_009936 [Agrocybe pediades]
MALAIDYSRTYYIRSVSTQKYLAATSLNSPVVLTDKVEDALHQWKFVKAGPTFHYLQCIGVNGMSYLAPGEVYNDPAGFSYYKLITRWLPATMNVFLQGSTGLGHVGMTISGGMDFNYAFSGQAHIRAYNTDKLGAVMDYVRRSLIILLLLIVSKAESHIDFWAVYINFKGQIDTLDWVLEPGPPASNPPRAGTQEVVQPNRTLPSLTGAMSNASFYIRNVFTGNYLNGTFNTPQTAIDGWILSDQRAVNRNEAYYQWKFVHCGQGKFHLQNVGIGQLYSIDRPMRNYFETGPFFEARTRLIAPNVQPATPAEVTVALDVDNFVVFRVGEPFNGQETSFYLQDQGAVYAVSTLFGKGNLSQWARCQWVLEIVPGSYIPDNGSGGNGTSTGGNDPSTGGNGTSTGGNDPSTGGNGTSTGGNDPSTGGNGTSTGGNGPSTGGNGTSTGGNGPSTGGNGTSTGGNGTSTGGNDPSTGGNGTSTGGNGTSTGGNGTSTGGNDPSTGGNGTSTGGNGTSTGGNGTSTGGNDGNSGTGNDGTGNNPNSGEQVRVLLANSVYNLESVDEDSFFYVTPNDDLDSTRTRLHGAKFKVDYVDGGSTAKKFVLSYKSSDGSQSYIVVNGHGDRLETSNDKNYAAQWALVAAPSKYREPGGTNAYYTVLNRSIRRSQVTGPCDETKYGRGHRVTASVDETIRRSQLKKNPDVRIFNQFSAFFCLFSVK